MFKPGFVTVFLAEPFRLSGIKVIGHFHSHFQGLLLLFFCESAQYFSP
jgi:hypothetical protein